MRIDIDGLSLESQWWGASPGEAPTIVMLHEGLGSVSIWRDFPQKVAEATGAGVFAYSRAGHGQSSPGPRPKPVDDMHREARNVLPKLLDAIGFRRGLLLGHSDGGSIAAIYAGSVQDHRVRGLILIEPHFSVEEKNIAAIEEITRTFRTTDLRDRLARHHADVDAMFDGWSGMWLDPRFRAFDLTGELSHIRVPILFIKSEDYPYSTMEKVRIADTECYCPVETVLIANAGHVPHRSQPKRTLAAVAEFANRILRDHGEAGMSAGRAVRGV
jgi:pimeloyl-ACP methyl ester carboxylesterase